MAITTAQKTKLNKMNRIAQDVSLGEVVCIRKLSQTVTYDEFTDGGGASGTLATDMIIPAGATFLYSAVTAVSAFAGNVSAVLTIGDGSDADRYNTGTLNVFTTAASGVAAGAPSGVLYHTQDKTVTLTVTSSSDFTSVNAGSATISVYYLD